jgi:hypothetical protein
LWYSAIRDALPRQWQESAQKFDRMNMINKIEKQSCARNVNSQFGDGNLVRNPILTGKRGWPAWAFLSERTQAGNSQMRFNSFIDNNLRTKLPVVKKSHI